MLARHCVVGLFTSILFIFCALHAMAVEDVDFHVLCVALWVSDPPRTRCLRVGSMAEDSCDSYPSRDGCELYCSFTRVGLDTFAPGSQEVGCVVALHNPRLQVFSASASEGPAEPSPLSSMASACEYTSAITSSCNLASLAIAAACALSRRERPS